MNQEKGKYRGKLENDSRVSTKAQKKFIEILKEQFPDLPNPVLGDILSNVEWDVNRAIEQLSDGGWSQPIDSEFEILQSQVSSASAYPVVTESASVVQNNYNPYFYNEIVGSTASVNTLKLNPGNSEIEKWIEELKLDETNVHKIGVPKERISHVPSSFSSSSSTSSSNSIQDKSVKNNRNFVIPEVKFSQEQLSNKEEKYSGPSPRTATLYDVVKASSSKLTQSNCDTLASKLTNNDYKPTTKDFHKFNGYGEGIKTMSHDDIDPGLSLHNGDLFPPTEGNDDYFDLQLSPTFVSKLFKEYSNPFGLLKVSELPPKDLNIKIPPLIAFELYNIFYLQMVKKLNEGVDLREEKQQRELNSSPCGIHDGYTEEELEDIVKMSDLTSDSSPDFLKIQEYEMRLNQHEEKRIQNQRSKVPSNLMASKLALRKLHSAFPTLTLQEIETYYGACNCKYDETFNALISSYATKFDPDGLTDTFQLGVQRDMEVSTRTDDSNLRGQQDLNAMTHEELRELAMEHYKLRRKCQTQISQAKRESHTASYYTEKFREHDEMMRKANKAAADMILAKHNGPNEPKDKLDLHFLHVQEAISATQKFLRDRTKYMEENNLQSYDLRIITGKGKNSDVFGSRLGPAILHFLKKNHYSVIQSSGYLEVTLENPSMQRPGGNFGK